MSMHKLNITTISLSLVLFFCIIESYAQEFKPNNIAVVRTGNPGKTAIYAGPNEVFIDEYTTGGTFVKTIPLPSRRPTNFRVSGYFRGDLVADLSRVDFAKLTHINIAFINPDSGGDFPAVPGLANFVTQAHAANVKVLASIGGGSAPSYYSTLINPSNRAAFIANISTFLSSNQLDGIDVDLEGNLVNADYEGFVTALAAAIKPGKLLSGAVATSNGSQYTSTALAAFDYINVMSYDKTGPWNPSNPGQHSPYKMIVDDVLYWNINKGISRTKLNMGLPFYGYGFNGATTTSMRYGKIVNVYPGAENVDQVSMTGGGTMYFNGIPTIKSKTTLALSQTGGVAIWQILQDTVGSKSLLNAIHEVITSSANNYQLVLGNNPEEGFLTRSNDKRFLTLTGYAKDIDGSGTLSATSAAAVNRSVAVINSSGMLDVSTALNNFCSLGSPRSAVTSNGNNLWLVGANGGVSYASKGNSALTATVSSAITDIRSISEVSGQLLVTANSSGIRTASVGSGIPVSTGNTITNLPGIDIANIKNAYQFYMADLTAAEPGDDVLYVASKSTSTTNGGIFKFSKVGGTWVANGSFDVGPDKNYKAITGMISSYTVFLYVTRNTTEGPGGELVKVKDAKGHNLNFEGSQLFAIQATATPGMANAAFRGVAIVPEGNTLESDFSTSNGNLQTLPINFKSVNLSKEGEDVLIKWSGDKHNDKNGVYEIQYSASKYEFKKIGTLSSQSSADEEYSFSYKEPTEAIGYYRIKFSGSNGASTFSEIKRLKLSANFLETRFSDEQNSLILTYNTRIPINGNVEIYHLSGKKIYSKKFLLQANETFKSIALPILIPGIYIAKSMVGQDFSAIKFFKK